MGEQKDKRLKHFENLVAMAAADGKIVHEEEVSLLNKSRELRIHAADAFDIFSKARKVRSLSLVDGIDAKTQLLDLMQIAKADGIIMPEEYQLCYDLAKAIGVSKNALDKKFSDIPEVEFPRSA